MQKSSFADRFWFARRVAEVGAPTLMRQVGELIGQSEGNTELSPSLISAIERRGLKSSRYNDAFARALNVDPSWLANEEGPAPKGFDAEAARLGRLAEIARTRRGAPIALVSEAAKTTGMPTWAEPDEEQRLQRMRAKLTSDLMEFAIAAGAQTTENFLNSVKPLLATFAAKKVEGKDKTRTAK